MAVVAMMAGRNRKPAQRPQADREIRAQGEHDEMERTTERRLSRARWA